MYALLFLYASYDVLKRFRSDSFRQAFGKRDIFPILKDEQLVIREMHVSDQDYFESLHRIIPIRKRAAESKKNRASSGTYTQFVLFRFLCRQETAEALPLRIHREYAEVSYTSRLQHGNQRDRGKRALPSPPLKGAGGCIKPQASGSLVLVHPPAPFKGGLGEDMSSYLRMDALIFWGLAEIRTGRVRDTLKRLRTRLRARLRDSVFVVPPLGGCSADRPPAKAGTTNIQARARTSVVVLSRWNGRQSGDVEIGAARTRGNQAVAGDAPHLPGAIDVVFVGGPPAGLRK